MKPGDISSKRILISPLDWGMGHTTRCIPLIRQLIEQKNQVVFAGNATQSKLISKDFPDIVVENMEGYNIKLDPTKSTYFQVFGQLKQFQKAVRNEREIARQLVIKHKIEVIISDNRYGFLTDTTSNIFMTHQLSPPVPKFRQLLTKRLVRYVNQFDYCWIPDDKDNPLVPHLNDLNLQIPKYNIGWLSRFQRKELPKEYNYLVIVSGPEPARTQFTLQMKQHLDKEPKVLFVMPEKMNESVSNEVINPSTGELEKLINVSEKIISRAGYTTIMELMSLEKEAILIPTPGQYEQKYLAQTVTSRFITFLTENEYFK